jgi:hypothetical protein
MEVRILELRDAGTFIPLLCINLGEADDAAARYLMRRCGYPLDGRPNIAITHLACDIRGRITNDPYQWSDGARTYPIAHHYIIEHWDELKNGSVVDVRFILGEMPEPCLSESEGWV